PAPSRGPPQGVAPSARGPYIIRQVGMSRTSPTSCAGGDDMQVGRRDFLRLTASAGAGTAIGGLVGLGVTLAPAEAGAQGLGIKQTRDETFIEKLPNGKLVNMTPAMFALGGATLDNEFNHVCQKFWRGLGVVAIENQARI